jgi:PAS domain-containing protein
MRVGYVPDFDVAGNVCGWIASITDITDRKRTEEALRDSEARLTTFLEQLPIGVGAVDLEGRWTIRNAVMRDFAVRRCRLTTFRALGVGTLSIPRVSRFLRRTGPA